MEEHTVDGSVIFSRNVRTLALLGLFFLAPAIQFILPVPSAIEHCCAAVGIAYWTLLFAHCQRQLASVDRSNAIYSEKAASGYSHLNLLTRLGGASNCLKMQLTKDHFIISSWFPFSLIAPLYDGVHIIPLANIVSITPKDFLWRRGYSLLFKAGDSGRVSTFSIYPRRPEQFEAALAKYITA